MQRPTPAVLLATSLLLACARGELPPGPAPGGAVPGSLGFPVEPRFQPTLAVTELPLQPPASGQPRAALGGAGLVFPVAGHGLQAIGGGFGDDRGRREHGGVDIFAPRGTPVVAAASGLVTRVERDRLGGRVIWVFDAERDLSFFYAHLERQLVKPGARVEAGDTIGTVGNSGNARRSSPHLHFAIFRPGTVAVDPAPFLVRGVLAGSD